MEDYTNLSAKTSEALKLFGSITILFNNGGISQRSLAKATAIEVDKRIMDINYLSSVAISKAIFSNHISCKIHVRNFNFRNFDKFFKYNSLSTCINS